MKNVKKISAVLLAVSLMLSLGGCEMLNRLDDKLLEEDESSLVGEYYVSSQETASEGQGTEADQNASGETDVSGAGGAEETDAVSDNSNGESSATDSPEGEESDSNASSQASSEDSSKVGEESSKATEESSKTTEESSKAGDESSKAEKAPRVQAPRLSGDYMGEILSETETAMDLKVIWAAKGGTAGSEQITLQFFVCSYSLGISERYDNELVVTTISGEETYYFDTYEVDKEEDTYEEIYVGSLSFTVSEAEFASGIDIAAHWNFWGSYSDKELEEVVAEGRIAPSN